MSPPSLNQPIDEGIVAKITKILVKTFPSASVGHIKLLAQHLTFAPQKGTPLHHKGKEDRDALNKVDAALRRLDHALNELSDWVATGLRTDLTRIYVNDEVKINDLESMHPPITVKELKGCIFIASGGIVPR
ncbi:MAG: hypothetical protein HKN18_04660 [Silicimonas sp.]|nr:hypothetical protein [Silicimonas sp.]